MSIVDDTKRKTQDLDMTEGSVLRLLLIFTLPILASGFLQQLYTTIDALILGQFAGKIGLSAIDSVYNFLKLPINFFIGFSAGATIIISQSYGAKDHDRLNKAIHTCICLSVFAGFILSLSGFLTGPFFIRLLKVPDEIYPYALSYLRIYFSGLLLSLLFNTSSGILRAIGDSKTPFISLGISGILNILLDLLFVVLLRLNAAGAALATVISQGISAVFTLFQLHKQSLLNLSEIKSDNAITNQILRIGIPIGFQSALFPIANMIVQGRINSSGSDCIAAWALCGKMDFMIWLICDSMAAAIATFAAQNYGAGKPDRARSGVRMGMIITLISTGIFSALLYYYAEQFGRIFINRKDWDTAILAGSIMRFIAPTYFFYSIGEIISGAIRAYGRSFVPMLITLLCTCGTRIIWIVFFTTTDSKIKTILSCYPLSWIITAVVFVIYYQFFKKKIMWYIKDRYSKEN